MWSRSAGRGGFRRGWMGVAFLAVPLAFGCGGDQKAGGLESSGQAALGASSFEGNDGDMTSNTATPPGNDWGNPPANIVTKPDLASGQHDDSFGQGTKEDTAVPTVVDGSIPNNKSDLTQFSVASETIGLVQYMYLRWTRANTLGTANIDFEFNQSKTLSANGVTPVRTAGDVLITFDFNGGGDPTKVVLSVSKWTTSGDPAAVCEASNSVPCWGKLTSLTSAGFANGAVNLVAVDDPIQGFEIPEITFGEAAIDLTGSGIVGADECNPFASAYVKSRSSASFTAATKDVIAPQGLNFQTCGTINIHKVDDLGNPLQGAVFTLFTGAPTGTTCSGGAVVPAKSCETNASGNCSITDVKFGTYCVAETTTPANHFTAAAQSVTLSSGTVSVTLPDFVDRRKLTVEITKTDDVNAPLAGAEFTLYQSDGVTFVQKCTTAVGTGKCSLTNLDFGSYVLKETIVPDGYAAGIPPTGHAFTLTSASPQVTPLSFSNPRLFRIITIVCRDSSVGAFSLYPSSVAYGASPAVTSLTAAQAQAAGVSAATVCGLPAALLSNQQTGVYGSSITIQ